MVYEGLKSLASLQSTRQLDEHTAASVALTWQPGVGAGLQLQTNRQLTERLQGPQIAIARCGWQSTHMTVFLLFDRHLPSSSFRMGSFMHTY